MGTYSPHRPPHRSPPSSLRPKSRPDTTQQQSVRSPQVRPSPRRRSPRQGWQMVGAIALLLVTGAGVVGLGWVGLQLIVKPQALPNLTQWLPGWQRHPTAETPTQTLSAIRAALHRQGQQAGELMNLGKNQSVLDGKQTVTEWLMPVRQTVANCFSDCDRLVELRIYQQAIDRPRTPDAKEQYLLVTQLPLTGLEESFAIAPLVDATSTNQGSSRKLPLTQLHRYEGTVPTPGIWFNVSGQRTRGDEAIVYGQIVYYYPKTHHLSVKLSWTSPTAEQPVWKNITGGNPPELLVNQTIGMEPQFEIYQVKPQRFLYSPVQLEAIALSNTQLDETHYQNALWLARNRLWSTSLAWLQGLQARSPQLWTEPIQAQMDLIQWHAQATQNQANNSWASPSQQILANLLDGRWERATTVFEQSLAASQETVGLLKADQGRLSNRVKAALRVNPRKLEIKIWGALLLAVQQPPAQAIAWLQKQPHTSPADITRIRTLIQRLDPNFEPVNLEPANSEPMQPSTPTLKPTTAPTPAPTVMPEPPLPSPQ